MANVAEPSYPREFHSILMALREDGTPITIDKGTPEAAERYRLQFYNFLKWAKRQKNATATVHLAGRQHMTGLSVKGSKISFILKNGVRFRASEDDVLAQLAAQGVDLDTLKVPESHNNKAFMQHKTKNEVAPLRPEYQSDAPVTTLAEPIYNPNPGAIGFAPPAWVNDEMMKLVELSNQVRDNPPERELVETSWFPSHLRGAVSAASHGPQDKAQWVLNKLIFDAEPALLPYPVARGDSHEVSDVLTGKREAEWHRFILDMEWEACLSFTKTKDGWLFMLTNEAEERLRAHKISSMVRIQAGGDLTLKNELRATISQLFKGL
jgi:hypothetical protein